VDAPLKLPQHLPLDRIAGGVLRLLGEEDWGLEQRLSNVADVPRWTMYPAAMSEAQARLRGLANRERAAAGTAARYVVEVGKEPLGTAGIAFPGRGPEVAYALLPAGRGAGLATAAVQALTQWAAAAGYPVVRLHTMEGNQASEKVAERAGFTRAGQDADEDGTVVTVWVSATPAGIEA